MLEAHEFECEALGRWEVVLKSLRSTFRQSLIRGFNLLPAPVKSGQTSQELSAAGFYCFSNAFPLDTSSRFSANLPTYKKLYSVPSDVACS